MIPVARDPLAELLAKEEIRELALLYARAIDRQDMALCRSLYTADGWDSHGTDFDGTADDFVAFLAASLPSTRYTGHHMCNHLIALDGDTAEGEVYALAYHEMPGADRRMQHLVMNVRYLDHYRREGGRWRFARRRVTYDSQLASPLPPGPAPTDPARDESYAELQTRLFQRGERS